MSLYRRPDGRGGCDGFRPMGIQDPPGLEGQYTGILRVTETIQAASARQRAPSRMPSAVGEIPQVPLPGSSIRLDAEDRSGEFSRVLRAHRSDTFPTLNDPTRGFSPSCRVPRLIRVSGIQFDVDSSLVSSMADTSTPPVDSSFVP